ncbi:MAG: 4Fe-4S ferredoxin [Candidatus Nezhaarchaeota archaeon]|nr:4Fe-4S ferredoxin [Candidatus Nezhaarchaeota archaeon]
MSFSLMSISVTSRLLKGKHILIYGKCIETEHPHLLEEVAREKTALHVCMSEEQLDGVGFKVATIMAYANPASVVALSMDGSPHCTQLHAIVEQAKKISKSNPKIIHLVVERGALVEVTSEAVYLSRHLSKIQELMKLAAKKNL